MYVDSHCHLDYPELSSDLEGVFARAKAHKVERFLTISTELEKRGIIRELIEDYAPVFGTVGVHPHEAKKTLDQLLPKELKHALLDEALHPKIVAFGETGLDYYYEHSPKGAQHESFIAHIEAGLETDLPLIVHTRDAEEDTINVLKQVGCGRSRGVIHCFTGTPYLAQEALALGFYISVSGIVTFNKAEELRATLKDVPLDRLLIETDAPYLAPTPHRGKPNEPSYVIYTAEKLAELKDMPLSAIETATTENFFSLFNKVIREK